MSINVYSYITCQSDTKWMNCGGGKKSTCVTGFEVVMEMNALFWDLASCYLLSQLRVPNLEGLQMLVNK
jgi:hypothetical protein